MCLLAFFLLSLAFVVLHTAITFMLCSLVCVLLCLCFFVRIYFHLTSHFSFSPYVSLSIFFISESWRFCIFLVASRTWYSSYPHSPPFELLHISYFLSHFCVLISLSQFLFICALSVFSHHSLVFLSHHGKQCRYPEFT